MLQKWPMASMPSIQTRIQVRTGIKSTLLTRFGVTWVVESISKSVLSHEFNSLTTDSKFCNPPEMLQNSLTHSCSMVLVFIVQLIRQLQLWNKIKFEILKGKYRHLPWWTSQLTHSFPVQSFSTARFSAISRG